MVKMSNSKWYEKIGVYMCVNICEHMCTWTYTQSKDGTWQQFFNPGKDFLDRPTVQQIWKLWKWKVKNKNQSILVPLSFALSNLKIAQKILTVGSVGFTDWTNHFFFSIPTHFAIHPPLIYPTNNHWKPFVFWVHWQILGI